MTLVWYCSFEIQIIMVAKNSFLWFSLKLHLCCSSRPPKSQHGQHLRQTEELPQSHQVLPNGTGSDLQRSQGNEDQDHDGIQVLWIFKLASMIWSRVLGYELMISYDVHMILCYDVI